MKKFFIKILACVLIALTAISAVSMCMPVSASTLSYYVENFSFAGTCSIGRNCTGMFMDVKVKATASNNNNETITLQVQVQNTGKVHTYTFLSDNQYHEYKNIYLGLSGGSSVGFIFTGANPAITINMEMIVT